jgi:DNA-binding CsgD family transcriptional regulator/tetratricopeptide (TPR) repeat protein
MLTATAHTNGGQLALVYGEAGIGKTALLRRFCLDASGSARVLWGKCDQLFTPRPLGPLLDIAQDVGAGVAEVLRREGTPHDVASALADMLVAGRPSIVVLEDMHLADEATLDVLRVLGGRVRALHALIIVSYRDDELDRWHPLRLVLADVGAAAPITRLKLPRLTPDAVAAMAADQRVLGEELYLRTAGNPFFVTEVLASDDEQIPESVRDAILSRAARLSGGARRLLEAIAVAGPQGELWLLQALAHEDVEFLEEAIVSGIVSGAVNTETGGISFRHELARQAVEESIPGHRRQALHRQALELLSAQGDGVPDPARLAHHAATLGDAEAMLKFAPLAGAQAARLGAHRQAAVHYRGALRFGELVPLEARARLSSGCARESFMIVQFSEAVEAQREALSCYEQLGDRRGQGAALSFLAHLLWQTGSLSEALPVAERALVLLQESPGAELVRARCEMARLQLAAEDPAAGMIWAQRAQELAEGLDDSPSRIEALQTLGWVEFFSGVQSGFEKLVESVEMAQREGIDWLAVTGCVTIVRTACRRHEYEIAEPYIQRGLEHCSHGDFDLYRYYLLSWQSKVSLAAGRWAAAADVAHICLADPCPFARIHALVALGLVRARRGDPDVWGPLDEALELAEPRHEQQWIAPVAIARAEAAWLEGRQEAAIAETEAAFQDAAGTWWRAGLSYWRWRSGSEEPIPEVGEEQYRLEMGGAWTAASEGWDAIGCPYEAALALLDGDEDALRRALKQLRLLEAGPAARFVAARLREIGAHGVPRGPISRTRENPAGLTARELEVLAALAEGLRNAQIAERLVLSERTVDHHVSAILGKLDAGTRGEASAKAVRLGLTGAR